MRRLANVLALAGAVVVALACAGRPASEAARPEAAAPDAYDVRILRDTWGVPHIFGRRDVDAAFGLAYAHAEDDFVTIEEALLAVRGRLASLVGRRGATNDYLIHWLRIWDVVDARYDRDLSPETRAIAEAYAAGINHYAALHPEEVRAPGAVYTGRDVVAGFVRASPFFYGLERTLGALSEGRLEPGDPEPTPAPAGGSNAFAVAPRRSADGATRLAVNSHQPWEGPVAWYEAHVHSEEGWDMVGGVFPGTPVILHGHNRHLGFAATVNRPDLVDVYRLDLVPGHPDRYRLDGSWYELERRTARIHVRLLPFFAWTFERETLRSVHGPVLRFPHGTYALRLAGAEEVRQLEQWYRMNKARTLDEWLAAMRMRAIPSFNWVYADREGNIAYLYNARLPQRSETVNPSRILPGNRSDLLWTELVPFEQLPLVRNPASGFVQSCNSSPYRTTLGPGNPDPRRIPPRLGIETRMTNRALRALELYGGDESISADEFEAYKYDEAYSTQSRVAEWRWRILDAPTPDDPVVADAVRVLRTWDLRTDPDNRAAAIAVLTFEPLLEARNQGRKPPDLMESFAAAAHALHRTHGRIDVPWREVNRLRRGGVDLGLGGGPDVLRAVKGDGLDDDGHRIATGGDSLVLLVEWDRDGNVRSRSIQPYGSATSHPDSPHYADQAPLFAAQQMKPVWMDEAEIRAHLEREYRPGEEIH